MNDSNLHTSGLQEEASYGHAGGAGQGDIEASPLVYLGGPGPHHVGGHARLRLDVVVKWKHFLTCLEILY